MLQDFGIIVACCKYDYLFAKGCVASIRYFLGDVPIALIVDGDVSTRDLEKTYGVQVIRKQNVRAEALRNRSFGMGITKMIAFWESPWENFFYLDADTVIWGDILKHADFERFDFISDVVRSPLSEQHISNYFFDTQRIHKFFPDFDWQQYRDYYFCTGAFFAKRGIFHLEEYLEILDLVEREPDLFFIGEQGFLNLMMCRAAAENRIRLGQADLQFLVPDYSREIAERCFPVTQRVDLKPNKTNVIHWCGSTKPISILREHYTKPMTFCRRQFLQEAQHRSLLNANTTLLLEDLQFYLRQSHKRIRRKVKRLLTA